MNKTKLIMIIAILVLAISFSGCNGIGGTKTKESELQKDIYKGTSGLVIEFMQNLPPNELYDSSNLHIVAELKNKGTKDVSGTIYLTGIDQSIIRGIDTEKYFGPIDPITRYDQQGGFETLEFESTSIEMPKGADSLPVDLGLIACYDYETLANPLVCIDPNIGNVLRQDKTCGSKSVSVAGGQGAPVAVTHVESTSTGERVVFSITIQNSGKGQVTDTGRNCPFNLEYDDLNKVFYDVSMSGMPPEKCSPSEEVRLANGKGTITCTFDIPQENKFAYDTPLQIRLRYGYTESISKRITLKHIG